MAAIAMAEPYKFSAGALALLIHAIFFSLLYFSFSWQMKPPQGMVVDIWDSLPGEVVETVPVQAQPEKQEPVANPKLEDTPASPPKAEIEVKKKKSRVKEEKQKFVNSAAKKLAEKKAEQAERRMEEVERQAQAHSQAQRKAQQQAAAAAGKMVDEYVARIAARIRRYIVLPPGVAKNIRAEFNVTLLPGGEVLSANLVKSSGNEAYDSAVERAILKAQPLPLPSAEQNLFNRFRELRLKFSPAESVE